MNDDEWVNPMLMNRIPTVTKATLPCIHVWKFKHSENEFDDYFECVNCHKQAPYCPEDLYQEEK